MYNPRPALLTMAVTAGIAAVFFLIGLYLTNSSVTAMGMNCDDVISYIPGSDTPGAACVDAEAGRHTAATIVFIVGGIATVACIAALFWGFNEHEKHQRTAS
jgi:hypothetical protein